MQVNSLNQYRFAYMKPRTLEEEAHSNLLIKENKLYVHTDEYTSLNMRSSTRGVHILITALTHNVALRFIFQ